MIREKSAGVIVFRWQPRDGLQFLALKMRGTYWNFPKGKIDGNESEMEAAKRELDEETDITNIKLINGWRQETDFFFREERNGRQELIKKNMVLFLAKLPKDAKLNIMNRPSKNEVVNGYAWLDFETAKKYLKFKNLKQIITEANSFVLDRINSFQEQKKS